MVNKKDFAYIAVFLSLVVITGCSLTTKDRLNSDLNSVDNNSIKVDQDTGNV
jgi:hypothetical protein